MRDDIAKSKAAEAERLAQLSLAALIHEFPDDTKALAAVPPDKPRVVEPQLCTPSIGTARQLQSGLGDKLH